jgi:peptide-methionine (S)-S-oxide reductase
MLKSLQYCSNIVLVSCVLFSGNLFSKENTQEQTAPAIFAGGFFLCIEQAFDTIPGVLKTIAGYTGDHTENPTYATVSNGNTGT